MKILQSKIFSYRIITLVIYTCSGAPMTNSDPRKIDFSSYLYLGICISPYFQINVENFSNKELISAGGVISAIMYITKVLPVAKLSIS